MIPPTLRQLTAGIAQRYGLTVEDLRGPSSKRLVAHPRHEAFAEIHDTGRFSLGQIGFYFGGRHHTTVRTGIIVHRTRASCPQPHCIVWTRHDVSVNPARDAVHG